MQRRFCKFRKNYSFVQMRQKVSLNMRCLVDGYRTAEVPYGKDQKHGAGVFASSCSLRSSRGRT